LKASPAQRMWAPGKENLHHMQYPRRVQPRDMPAARLKAEAFSRFLPAVVVRIHALDPDHPVVYRDAEDVYLTPLKAAFQATGVQRPWLVYGVNVYSLSRLEQIIQQWPRQWIGGPLLISEFAPGGVGPDQRAAGFDRAWTLIRSRPDVVLGGLAYTWASNGQEEVDSVFGLVDPTGAPRDTALSALALAYSSDVDPVP
jgi:hypothetical protein